MRFLFGLGPINSDRVHLSQRVRVLKALEVQVKLMRCQTPTLNVREKKRDLSKYHVTTLLVSPVRANLVNLTLNYFRVQEL